MQVGIHNIKRIETRTVKALPPAKSKWLELTFVNDDDKDVMTVVAWSSTPDETTPYIAARANQEAS